MTMEGDPPTREGPGGRDGATNPDGAASPQQNPRPVTEGGRTRASVLARELGGDLACPRCHYNLKGLSVRGNCPECGLPVRAALLALVDPLATELRPITRPTLLATGLVLWGLAAFLACIVAWIIRLVPYTGIGPVVPDLLAWLRVFLPVLIACAGLGAVSLVRPHDGIPRRGIIFALLGVLAHAPLVVCFWFLYVSADPIAIRLNGQPSWIDRSSISFISQFCIIAIALCLRPNARVLVSRSKLLRAARVDRQVLLGLAGVVGMIMVGDIITLVAHELTAPGPLNLSQLGRLVHVMGSILFTLGVGGVFLDCLRLLPAVLQHPLSVGQAISHGRSPSSSSPATRPDSE